MKRDTKYAAAMVAVAIAGAAAIMIYAKSARAAEDETVAIPVPLSRMQQCMQGGGCALVTRDEYLGAMREAFEAGKEAARKQCTSKSI